MSYLESSLMPGEQIVYRAKVNPLVYGWPIFWLVVIYFVSTKFGAPTDAPVDPAVQQSTGGMLAFGMTVLVFVAILSWLRALGTHLGTEYGVTNKRVVLKRGLIMRKTAEIMVGKVEGLGITQTIPGRIFSYGTIVIGGTGGDKSGFPFCSNPNEFRKQVAMQADAQQNRPAA